MPGDYRPQDANNPTLAALGCLLPALVPFDDWPGSLALVRAVPTQRMVPIGVVVPAVAAWLQSEEDLFDAQRAFVRLEGNGSRPIVEVLTLLRSRDRTASPLIGGRA